MYEEIFHLHAQLLKAIAHPRRLEIIHLLRNQKLCVSSMVEMLNLPQANISQHLQILRDSQMVKTEKNGKQIIYSLSHPNVIKASDLMRELLLENYKKTISTEEFNHSMLELTPIVHDPVCQMRISPKTSGCTYKFKNKIFYFCATGCLQAFKKSPEKYL